jgi:hypothetical protein
MRSQCCRSNATECIQMLQEACQKDSQWQYYTMPFGFTVGTKNAALAQLSQDLAFSVGARTLCIHWVGHVGNVMAL